MFTERGFVLLAIVALISTIVATFAISDVAEFGGADQAGYLVMAQGILEGEGFVSHTIKQYDWAQQEIVTPDVVEPMGASMGIAFFFALFGITTLTGKLFSILSAFLLIPLLVYALARAWNHAQRTAFFAGLFALFYPVSYFVHLYALSDDPAVMWLLAGLVCFFTAKGNAWRYIWGGFFFGIAVMTKYTSVFVWLILGIYGLWALWKRTEPGLSLRSLTLFFVIAVLVTTPFFARNIAYFGSPLFSVAAAQTWTIGYESPGQNVPLFFWDEGAPTLSWALTHITKDQLFHKWQRFFTTFFKEELIFVLLASVGLFFMRHRRETPFIIGLTVLFFFFFLIINHYEGRYFIFLHALWSIPISYFFFSKKSWPILKLAGIGFLILILIFIGLKFHRADTLPYGDGEYTINRAAFYSAINTYVPPSEPVMTYYPRGTDYMTRHLVLMQINEDPNTLLRILHWYNTSYIECGYKAPYLNTDPRFTVIYPGYYSLCKVNWEQAYAQGIPLSPFVNVTQDWTLSAFRTTHTSALKLLDNGFITLKNPFSAE